MTYRRYEPEIRNSREPRADLLQVFVGATARYLAAAPDRSDDFEAEIRSNILRYCVPYILGSERAESAFRSGLTPALAEQLLRVDAELQGEGRFRADQTVRLHQLLVESLKPPGL
jgi:hypothetical protein